MILSDLKAEILVYTDFYMAAIFKMQDGCHYVIGGGGSYQKWKAKGMKNTWKKFDVFVRNVHIHLLTCLTKNRLPLNSINPFAVRANLAQNRVAHI